ncbi:MAG: hypothetical protein KAQ83_01635 [Nanoarchaeota archaeon]|nr:hypothetical protein [Nanoarchaeota archaeon]
MDIILIYFLPLILFLGILTSYGDIKEGKIRNKWLIIAAILGILLWIVLILLNKIDYREFLMSLIFSFGALIIGFLFWLMKMWSAGDAKLYAIFVLLIPLSTYKYSNNWPIITLLTNIFLPVFLFLIIKLLIKSKNKEKLDILKNILKPKNLIEYFLFVFGLIWLINIFFGIFGIALNYLVSIILIIGISKWIEKVFQRKFFKKIKFTQQKLLIVLTVLRIVFQYKLLSSYEFWFNMLIITMIYAIIRMFLFSLGGLFVKKISLKELKEGMLISNTKYSERLTAKEVKDVKKMMNLKKQKDVFIEETIPFAPFIFLGILITILINGDIILILKLWFG